MAGRVEDSLEVRELIVTDKFVFKPGTNPTAMDATGISCTGWTSDVAMDCNTAADAEIADVLATLIKILQTKGILGGTVSA